MARKLDFARIRELRVPIATKLILSFLLIIAIISVVFIVAGIQLIGNRVVKEAQERVQLDLNSAREIYLSQIGRAHV
jgi:two-component system NtrC family sensor kinase